MKAVVRVKKVGCEKPQIKKFIASNFSKYNVATDAEKNNKSLLDISNSSLNTVQAFK